MEVYETALAGILTGMKGIEVRRQQWPPGSNSPKNRYLAALRVYWNRHLFYPSRLKKTSADLYHILDHSYAHLLSKLPPERTIITCHDLMPLMVEGYEKSWGGKLSIASFRHSVSYLYKARHVIADSEATKKALGDILGLADKNITVVPMGVDRAFFDYRRQDNIGRNGPIKVLQVGATAEPYKNTMNILRAFSSILQRMGSQVRLVKVGKPYTPAQQSFIRDNGLQGYIEQLGFVDRLRLPGIYASADVLLMPSLWEGFGLPVLEAMAVGTPVVTSRRGAIPEIAGNAVVYIEPDDPEDVARGVKDLLLDNRLRETLSRLGRIRAQQYTWENTVKTTREVYRKCQ
ncbi:MAG: glycosyltransferase family 1 protein [Candidatus Edwardsbacteria bacterium]|nr:glycosyltransferase family 1 protein [Candidatus Edwardsbacteria bacterium]